MNQLLSSPTGGADLRFVVLNSQTTELEQSTSCDVPVSADTHLHTHNGWPEEIWGMAGGFGK